MHAQLNKHTDKSL